VAKRKGTGTLAKNGLLASWNNTAARRRATERFVESVTRGEGPDFVSLEERVAVFDYASASEGS
jgi:hypothetical protein